MKNNNHFKGALNPLSPYNQAIMVNDTFYLSGQILNFNEYVNVVGVLKRDKTGDEKSWLGQFWRPDMKF